MQIIDAERVHRILDYPALVDALDAGHREGVDAVERSLLAQPGEHGATDHLLVWPAWQRGRALGVKVVTSFPANPAARGLPTVHAQYLLFDGESGAPRALIDGIALSLRKTAADSALGARYLARTDAATLLMVGAGAQAPHQIMAHLAVRPSIRRVLLWNRTRERAEGLAAHLALPGIAPEVVEDLAGAVSEAGVVCCATGATTPLIRGEWLRPGTHLDLVGGFTPQMREADDEAVRRSRVYVDSRRFTVHDCGDVAGPIASGALTEADIVADLFELARGERPGREHADEITLFKNGGGGHLDLMTARFVADRAPSSRKSDLEAFK
jgi:alanine dehydrogenase